MARRRQRLHWYERLGLPGDPFAGPAPVPYWDGERARLLGEILLATASAPAVLAITGPASIGKSVLRTAALEHFEGDAHGLALRGHVFLQPETLTRQLSEAWAAATGATVRETGSLRELVRSLTASLGRAGSVSILVDDADELPDACLELLLNLGVSFATQSLRVVLFGREGLAARLAAHEKVGHFQLETVAPLADADVTAYLEERLQLAVPEGGQAISLETRELKRIIHHSAGVPGQVDAEAQHTLRARVLGAAPRRRGHRSLWHRATDWLREHLSLSGIAFVALVVMAWAVLRPASGPASAPMRVHVPADSAASAARVASDLGTSAAAERGAIDPAGITNPTSSSAETQASVAANSPATVATDDPPADIWWRDASGEELLEAQRERMDLAMERREARRAAAIGTRVDDTAAPAPEQVPASSPQNSSSPSAAAPLSATAASSRIAGPATATRDDPARPPSEPAQAFARKKSPRPAAPVPIPRPPEATNTLTASTGAPEELAEPRKPEADDSQPGFLSRVVGFLGLGETAESEPSDPPRQTDTREVVELSPGETAAAEGTDTNGDANEADGTNPAPDTPPTKTGAVITPPEADSTTIALQAPVVSPARPDSEAAASLQRTPAVSRPATDEDGAARRLARSTSTPEVERERSTTPEREPAPTAPEPADTPERSAPTVTRADPAPATQNAASTLPDALREAQPADETSVRAGVVARTALNSREGAPPAPAAADASTAQRATAPPPSPASRSSAAAVIDIPRSDAVGGEREILSMPGDALVLQVMVLSSATRTALWLAERRGTGRYATYRRGERPNEDWVIVHGPFSKRTNAELAARDISERVGVENPWIRTVAEVQAEIQPR